METWILKMVKATSRRRVVGWSLVVAAAVWLGFAQHRYLSNFFFGPFNIGAAELESITDLAQTPRYFVKVTGTEALDTGIQQIAVRQRAGVEVDRAVSAAYYALVVGEKMLLYRGTGGPQTEVEGELTTIPESLAQALFGTPETVRLRSRFYPYLLSNEPFRVPGYLAIGGVLLLCLVLMRRALPAWRHLRDPATHPLIRRMKSWEDPTGISREAERADRTRPLYEDAGWRVTDTFVIQSGFFHFDLARLTDLVWAYKKVTKHSVNFIPTGRSFEAVLAFAGGTISLKANEKTVDEVIGFAAGKAPWAFLGFSPELKELAARPQEFLAAAEQRRLAWEGEARKNKAPSSG